MSKSRQLAAILFADIQGYTALMEEDEAKAIIVRDKFQKVLTYEIKPHNGRIIQLNGDGGFCIFRSAIEAVRAAIEIQMHMREEPYIPLRIGIHTGDVITDLKNVYGDGVNIASRIESFAVPGSIFISGRVQEDIFDQRDIQSVSLGKFKLKNVFVPVEIFAVSNAGLVVPQGKKLEGKGVRAGFSMRSSVRWSIALLLIFTIMLAGWLAYHYITTKPFVKEGEKSIAILPFRNLSADKNEEYFAEGVCNEIVSQLAKIREMRVVFQGSSAQYEKHAGTFSQIAKELGVAYLLKGSVQKDSNKVRISLQLINGENDTFLWAETYDREMKDIFVIQSDIAREVAGELHATISMDERRLIDSFSTGNIEAYKDYLKGNYFLDKRTPEAMLRSKEFFERAIALDPDFDAAYVGLAYSYIFRSNFYNINPHEGYPIAKELIAKSLRINANLSDAHAALGIIYGFHDWNFPGAEKEFRQALELGRNNQIARLGYGRCLYSSKKFRESIKEFNDALKQDPGWQQALNSIAWVYFFEGSYDSALVYIRKNQELNPDFFQPYRLEGLISLQQGKGIESLTLFQKAAELSGNNPEELAYLGYAYARLGNSTAAEKIIDGLQQLQGESKMLSFPIAMVYAGYHDKAKTFEYLDIARRENTADIMLVDVFPQFDFIKTGDQYQSFVKDAGIIYLK